MGWQHPDSGQRLHRRSADPPDNLHVVINTTANSVISGDINGAGSYHIDFTFTGTAPLTVNGDIRGFTNGDTITAQNGAQVTINGFIFIGDLERREH